MSEYRNTILELTIVRNGLEGHQVPTGAKLALLSDTLAAASTSLSAMHGVPAADATAVSDLLGTLTGTPTVADCDAGVVTLDGVIARLSANITAYEGQ